MKPVFDINKYEYPLAAMFCETQEEADIFQEYLDFAGKTWSSGASYVKSKYLIYNGGSYYFFNIGISTDKNTIERMPDIHKFVLEFSNYDWSAFEDMEVVHEEIFDDFLKEFKVS